jgi:hypothetical protein
VGDPPRCSIIHPHLLEAAMSKNVTLVHPDGERTYTTSDPGEINNLKVRGYTEAKEPKKSAKSDDKK